MEKNTATLQSLIGTALPAKSTLLSGDGQVDVNWAVTVRAQPPVFPEIYGGELALVSMDILKGYDSQLTLSKVIEILADVGVVAVGASEKDAHDAVEMAKSCGISLIALPDNTNLTNIERAINTFILNQSARLTEKAIEIQRELTRLAAENRDVYSLLQVIARETSKPAVIHDDAGVLMTQAFFNGSRRGMDGRVLLQQMPYGEFQEWLQTHQANFSGVEPSPIGLTTLLKVEKRTAGYLSLIGYEDNLNEFDRMVLSHGADVCAIVLAKESAIDTAVEQARGDWVQMWLSGLATDEDLLYSRATQSGFDPESPYIGVVFRIVTENGQAFPVDSLVSIVRDDMNRRQISGAVGQYVDMILVLYPIQELSDIPRLQQLVEEVRSNLSTRASSGIISAGISRPVDDLVNMRDAYHEAYNAIKMAQEIGDSKTTTYYGDLKLYQLLLALKTHNLEHLQRFYEDTLGALIEQDARKQSDLVETLAGFFEANGNLAKAAEKMNIHRNTLVYRLDQISNLTNFDLDEADNRLILHLALKIQRVMATLPQ